jgi:hypothetical protein
MAIKANKLVKVEMEIPPVSYELMEGMVKYLQGQVLTVVEATIVESKQQQATKSLIKSSFNDTLTRMFEIFMRHGEVPDGEIPKYEE